MSIRNPRKTLLCPLRYTKPIFEESQTEWNVPYDNNRPVSNQIQAFPVITTHSFYKSSSKYFKLLLHLCLRVSLPKSVIVKFVRILCLRPALTREGRIIPLMSYFMLFTQSYMKMDNPRLYLTSWVWRNTPRETILYSFLSASYII